MLPAVRHWPQAMLTSFFEQCIFIGMLCCSLGSKLRELCNNAAAGSMHAQSLLIRSLLFLLLQGLLRNSSKPYVRLRISVSGGWIDPSATHCVQQAAQLRCESQICPCWHARHGLWALPRARSSRLLCALVLNKIMLVMLVRHPSLAGPGHRQQKLGADPT